MKTVTERIADLEKGITDLGNRVQVMQDRISILETAAMERQQLSDALDAATVRVNLIGA